MTVSGDVSQHANMSDDLYLEDFDDTSIFENKAGLAEVFWFFLPSFCPYFLISKDMRFLASIPELCDITFLVGETREPVCAVKAVLAARSRLVIFIIIYYWVGYFDIIASQGLYLIAALEVHMSLTHNFKHLNTWTLVNPTPKSRVMGLTLNMQWANYLKIDQLDSKIKLRTIS